MARFLKMRPGMKRLVLSLIAASLLLLPTMLHSGDDPESPQIRPVGHTKAWTKGRHGYVVDEVLIKFHPYVGQKRQREHIAGLHAQTLQTTGALQMRRVRLPAGLSVGQALEKLQAVPDVQKAEPIIYAVFR